MTQLRELYQCEVCGNVVEVVNNQAGELKCCEQPMKKLEAKAEDAGGEKHVPIVEAIAQGIKVKVGSVEHPMVEDHYIKFIEVHTEKRVGRLELKPGQKPEIEINIPKEDVILVREFCTIHGLWQS